jgi:hypothetical protein
MQDHVSRLLGLERCDVKRVLEERDQLDLKVELVARAGCCPRYGWASLEVKDRPRARVRDLPIAGASLICCGASVVTTAPAAVGVSPNRTRSRRRANG